MTEQFQDAFLIKQKKLLTVVPFKPHTLCIRTDLRRNHLAGWIEFVVVPYNKFTGKSINQVFLIGMN